MGFHWCCGSKITKDLVEETYMPFCKYCGKPCRIGSICDPFHPYHSEESFHQSCHRKHKKVQNEPGTKSNYR